MVEIKKALMVEKGVKWDITTLARVCVGVYVCLRAIIFCCLSAVNSFVRAFKGKTKWNAVK